MSIPKPKSNLEKLQEEGVLPESMTLDEAVEELTDELSELIRNIEDIRDAVARGDREKTVALLSAAREKKEKFG